VNETKDTVKLMATLTKAQKQKAFLPMIAKLINFAYEQGFELTVGDAYRDPRVPYGQPFSLHRSRLAMDLNLYKDGVWLKKTEDHTPLGIYWESLGGAWGGRFSDGNHYSIEHEGFK
jgi:hypothetical protein